MFDMKNVPAFPTRHLAITPSDTNKFHYPMSVLVPTTGDVAVADENGLVLTYPAVPAWTILPITCSRVMATGTTATGLIGLYED